MVKKIKNKVEKITQAKNTKDILNTLEKPVSKKSENKVEDYINFLRALASPERLNILEALESQEMCTSDVEHRFYMEQSTASHHLNTLLKAHIVSCRKSGRRVFYHVNDGYLQKHYQEFVKALENIPKSKEKKNYKTK
ncbi:MAG: metalloregulator ArsR/SmtB family transcription factor [Candidatus Margulisbacteria bacterium]|nr:metalloregulator ArsR/SmtB family transcription factor [Candidatus Margulisiibacteriota bacterium]